MTGGIELVDFGVTLNEANACRTRGSETRSCDGGDAGHPRQMGMVDADYSQSDIDFCKFGELHGGRME